MQGTANSKFGLDVLIKNITANQIFIPKSGLVYEVYKLFLLINFNSNIAFWSEFGNTEMLLNEFPIFVISKNNREFEIVGGFRTFQLLNTIGINNLVVFDVSEASNQQLISICLQTTVAPLLVWSSSEIHTKSYIKSFLKDLGRLFPELKTIVPDGGDYSKSISRHIGRKRKVQLSNLSIKIAEKLELQGVRNGGK